MNEGIFKEGFLEMSTSPLQQAAESSLWGDCISNRVLAVLSILAFFLLFADFLRMIPSLMDCLGRYRANITLEHSVSKARSRNYIAMVVLVPFCLIVDKTEMFRPSFWERIPEFWSIFVTIGFISAYFILRTVLYLLVRPKGFNSEELVAVRHSLYNYFILASVLLIISLLLMFVFKVGPGAVRNVLSLELLLVCLIAFIRIGQFFGSHCKGFSTFLYLCALEFLPLGILIFVSTR